MKANHLPAEVRLRSRVKRLQYRMDASWIASSPGNPYKCCKFCNIHTPEYYRPVEAGGHRHRTGCPMQGIRKQIAYYYSLMVKITGEVPPYGVMEYLA